MNRIALLVIALAAGVPAAGCNNQKPEERKLPPTAAPALPPGGSAQTPPPAPGSAAAPGSASPAAGSASPTASSGARFAPFDDALAGAKPWLAAGDKAGLVELHAVDDLSDRTKGKFTVDRRCGPDADKAVEAVAKRIAERAKTGHEAPTCKEDGAVTSCLQPGLAEGDVVLEIQYGKSGDAWRVIGVKTYGVGITAAKEEAKYAALLKEPCK